MRTKRHRGAGLVVKFSLLMIILVVLIVAGIAVPLMVQMGTREQRTLADGLQKRAKILLESVALRAAEPIRAADYGTVSRLPDEISAMPREAISLTISGPGDIKRPGAPAAEDPLDRDYLWATNDDSMAVARTNEDSAEAAAFAPAWQQVSDTWIDRERVKELARSVNAAATEELQGEEDDSARQSALQGVAADEGSGHAGSVPTFDPRNLESRYLFYRPLVTLDPEGYYAGLVRLTISTEVIKGQVNDAIRAMVTAAGIVALVAVAMGVVGAILLASIAIRPIGRLVKAVSAIRDTEDRTRLEQIPVGARDEIGTLSQRVNEMTAGLVSAAVAEKEMLVGRAIQKQFLPLEPGADGEKGSTGGIKTADIDLYAFYEGATKVSGDYFDWQKLDDRYYAIMKCDVSGHGVEAAFIMVEVATLFLRWCREWKGRLAKVSRDAREQERAREELLRLDQLVYTINDMIEERGFGGKFAAFMLCVYDVRSGLVTACSAGDNVLHHFDIGTRSMVTQEIKPGNPAVGQIDSTLIMSTSGYPPVQLQLKPGEVLVLFTDGFEESKRSFRDPAGAKVSCTDPAHKDKKQDPLSTHKNGDTGEEMSVSRILGIFNAFFNRNTYRLERHHTVQAEELEFDFSGCSDSLEEAVLALVSVERVYRTYRDPQIGPKDRIVVEAKVDQYLRKHFRQYELYFGKQESGDQSADFVPILNIKEDVQEDDLTVVLLRRP